ncbi:hypothetical protein GCM10010387_16140 [Streptomyces inusitatus]|uniref:Uncharacterized protein n=1 Tax=Streptomyces inusitatus TaxID=68221 RepID=A0A918PUJ6_9ACTN|nr:hypothetical protein [Streptomyces inusitatus]GGZ23703.1 hypothetical protein GCM10010387_16140 [Streptomyces inusitatus]
MSDTPPAAQMNAPAPAYEHRADAAPFTSAPESQQTLSPADRRAAVHAIAAAFDVPVDLLQKDPTE